MILRLANRISPKPEYANTAQDSLHYLFGRNTFNTSYMGLYTNRLITQATVYNRACEISVRPIVPSQPTSDTIDEMMVNGDFADGIAEWQIEQQNGVKASAAVVPDGPNGQSAMRLDVEAVADEPCLITATSYLAGMSNAAQWQTHSVSNI
jgi:hypothetical protein